MTTRATIIGYARTPFTKFNGQLAGVPATELGAHAAAAAMKRAEITPDQVNFTIVGQVLQAASGQNPARQTAVGAGIPLTVPAITLNAVCLSGAEAVSQAVRLITTGEADIVLAVGQESMSRAPHAIRLRSEVRFGDGQLTDTLEHDGLIDAFSHSGMGALTEQGNASLGLSRLEQDAFAASSHSKASASLSYLAGEIAPITVNARKGYTITDADDGIRPGTTPERLADLRPAFDPVRGTITAGNSSQITDGAAALVIASATAVRQYALSPLAHIEATSFVAGPDTQLHSQPFRAIAAALGKVSATPADLQAVEINEAFAAVGVHSTRELGIDPAIVNRHGGAIALGHPLGASGVRIVGTLARQLSATGRGSLGAAGICGGGGQGSAVILRAD